MIDIEILSFKSINQWDYWTWKNPHVANFSWSHKIRYLISLKMSKLLTQFYFRLKNEAAKKNICVWTVNKLTLACAFNSSSFHLSTKKNFVWWVLFVWMDKPQRHSHYITLLSAFLSRGTILKAKKCKKVFQFNFPSYRTRLQQNLSVHHWAFKWFSC